MYKTLLVDIEMSPNIAHVWGLFDQNISLAQLQEPSRMLCFAAKWKGDRKTMFWSEFHHGRQEMVQAAYDLLSESDVVVHYNGKRFDIPLLKTEIVLELGKPPSPFRQVDLYQVVKNQFRFPSNKLAYVAKALGVGAKVSHEGHELWTKCMAGDEAAWRTMKRYCIQDTNILDPLLDTLLPWINNYPNARLIGDPAGCPKCEVGLLVKEGFAYASTGKYQRYSCKNCNSWFQDSRRVDGTTIKGTVL